MTTLADMMLKLAQPFDLDLLQWKPQATSRDKKKALAVPYVDTRDYIDRLNQVAGADWSDDYEISNNGAVVLCRLTVAGVTRCDVGEASASDANTATSAIAQAFKRAAVKFGLGRYLYSMPKTWVAYDEQRRCIAKDGLAQLRRVAAGNPAVILAERAPAARLSNNGSTPPDDNGHKPPNGNGHKPPNGNGGKPSNGSSRGSWPSATVQALLQAHVAEHPKHAVNILNKSNLPTSATPDEALIWARAYRQQRENGAGVAEAVAQANQVEEEFVEEPCPF